MLNGEHEFSDLAAVKLIAKAGIRHGGGGVDPFQKLPQAPAANVFRTQNIQRRETVCPLLQHTVVKHLNHELCVNLENQALIT